MCTCNTNTSKLVVVLRDEVYSSSMSLSGFLLSSFSVLSKMNARSVSRLSASDFVSAVPDTKGPVLVDSQQLVLVALIQQRLQPLVHSALVIQPFSDAESQILQGNIRALLTLSPSSLFCISYVVSLLLA